MTVTSMKTGPKVVPRSEILTLAIKTFLPLKCMPYIYYLLQFKKNQIKVQVLINSGSKVNIITPAYTKKLGHQTQKTDINDQKIDRSRLATYKIVIAKFQVSNKLSKACFFQATFLLVNTSVDIILGIPFLILNNTDVIFAD